VGDQAGLGGALGGLVRGGVRDPVGGVPVGDGADVPPVQGVLPQPFPGLLLDLEPVPFRDALLHAADQDGGGVHALHADGLVGGEQGDALVGQLALQLEGVVGVAPGPLDVLADHDREPGRGRAGLGQQVGHAAVTRDVDVHVLPGVAPAAVFEVDAADGFEVYVDLEAEASALRTYESQLVPGLLQTAEYAKAVLTAAWVTTEAEEIARRMAVRTRRQELALARDRPLQLWAVLDEAVLRRVVGGPEVMHAQLTRLAEAARQTNITLQVLPFGVGAHIAMLGTFVLVSFPEQGDPDIVYIETDTSSLYLEEPQEIGRYGEIFDHLRATALSPRESAAFIDAAASEFASREEDQI
jgi:Domain of unknown function (DUF5753)